MSPTAASSARRGAAAGAAHRRRRHLGLALRAVLRARARGQGAVGSRLSRSPSATRTTSSATCDEARIPVRGVRAGRGPATLRATGAGRPGGRRAARPAYARAHGELFASRGDERPPDRARDGSLVEAATEAIRPQIMHGSSRRETVCHRARARRRARRLAHRPARGALEPGGARPDRDARNAWPLRRGGRLVRAEPDARRGLAAPARPTRSSRSTRSARCSRRRRSARCRNGRRSRPPGCRAHPPRQAEAVERGDPVAAADGDAAFHRLLASYTKNGALRALMAASSTRAARAPMPSTRCPRRPRARSSSTAGSSTPSSTSDVETAARARAGAHDRRRAPLLGLAGASGGAVIRRFSLVRKRPELTRDEFLAAWTGEHVDSRTGSPGCAAT